ncbi:SPRY-domain-containing protein [Gloeophyllum trabeum ATCC 11539]|uniref:SPRY-domain-containing protein n=1 Tax=Gloeophyllum trabeum (strain ATCC 11539 / FP-39264 / Madison 617) TaxID=670483 RepID=S7S092_GLOTA|nr:SPRY-domain-containing protein [Gloeophyllum trabeum ATCC 11539]EPQ60765.1 SPRY-domain-containing protein [Gloeophyllum trabeum ATCC 11539]
MASMLAEAVADSWEWVDSIDVSSSSDKIQDMLSLPDDARASIIREQGDEPNQALLVLLPLLIVLSTFLFLLLVFLVCIILLRRRRGILLRDSDGPVDMSREELIEGEGGFEVMESRWLESVNEVERRSYLRAKEFQLQYPPNSLPTDITLSQFLSIQEKGVSAWSFEPDVESLSSLIVQGRTEITFLPDPPTPACVQSNLPLPKLNEVYYWEVKMFDLPPETNVAIGLTTKPYPYFRLPGLSRYSVAYHSNGDKSHNWPFTAASFGPGFKEGDVVGVGYRPRTGTVFFTRNGRKLEDAFVGLTRWNLFPTVGADGACSLHVNLGQAGFVFIEANVKKWGLAPSVGTLAPPPAYGSERGSILLQAGGETPAGVDAMSPRSTPGVGSLPSSRRGHRHRRPKRESNSVTESPPTTPPPPPSTPPPPITPIEEEPAESSGAGPSTSRRYISPTDLPFHNPPNVNLPSSPPREDADAEETEGEWASPSSSAATSRSTTPDRAESELSVRVHPPPESPISPNPPTPNPRDIHLQALNSSAQAGPSLSPSSTLLDEVSALRREPPSYSPLDPFAYQDGVHIDLPADVIAAALERGTIPSSAFSHSSGSRSERHRWRRDREGRQ